MYVCRFLCIVSRFFSFFFVLEDISLSGYSEIRVEIKFMFLCMYVDRFLCPNFAPFACNLLQHARRSVRMCESVLQ